MTDRHPKVPTYSPERRTALVLCGTGAHGAYHAGVLRALQEASVKIDIFAGHGIGAGGAVLAAIAGGSRLWEPGGVWRGPEVRTLYRWRPAVRAIGWTAALVAAFLVVPVAVLTMGLVAFPIGFLVQMVAPEAGAAIVSGFTAWTSAAFSGPNLPTIVPRLVTLVVALLVAGVAIAVAVDRARLPHRRASGAWWWRVAGAPIDGTVVRRTFADAVWRLVRGANAGEPPSRPAIGARYAEAVVESLGQPGFGELVLVATDLDGRRDMVAALLREPFRQDFLAPRPDRDRRSEVLDLSGVGRDHALDAVLGALTPPLWCEPHRVTFSQDSYWRGETHRVCDRPGIVSRLLEEVAAAGASQVIVVTAVGPMDAPHKLRRTRLDLLGRLGQFQMAAEAAALRDALEMARLRFDAIHVIRPAHNPVGPFDLAGAYDEASERYHSLDEVMTRAYEDAYGQFIEPFVGESGEQLADADLAGRAGEPAIPRSLPL
jgi:hypothetical protein